MPAIAFIFARGGSKGLPGKNTKLLNGKPLIAYAIEAAKHCDQIEQTIVSTDSKDIAEVAREYGAETPFIRPAELAGDNSAEWLAWQHAIDWIQKHQGSFDMFVSVPPTSPFRTSPDIDRCIDRLASDRSLDLVVTATASARSPYFNMVKLSPEGQATLLIKDSKVSRRQDAPQTYDLTTVAYAARPNFVMTHQHMFEGKVGLVEIPPERALDIDTPLDFQIAEFISQQNKSARHVQR